MEGNFKFKLLSTSAQAKMEKNQKPGVMGFWAYVNNVSKVIKAAKSKNKKAAEALLTQLMGDVQQTLEELETTLKLVRKKMKVDAHFDYDSVKMKPAIEYDAVFFSDISKKALRALIVYDDITTSLYKLTLTGAITKDQQAKIQRDSRAAFNKMLNEQYQKVKPFLLNLESTEMKSSAKPSNRAQEKTDIV